MSALLSSLPASIPSPPESWRIPIRIPLGQWLSGIGVPADFALQIHSYALCILAGIIAAMLLTGARLRSRGAEPGLVLDVGIFALLLGIIGARAYHVLTHPDDYFFAGADPWAVIRIWDGGIAIFGALIGGAIGVYLGCRLAGLRFWSFADALVPGLLLAQAFGRFGNWFNHELFGLPTDLPWGLEIEPSNPAFPIGLADNTLFHPTFLYEVIWNVIGVIALLAAEKRFRRGTRELGGSTVPALIPLSYRLQWGRLTGLYLVWYGTGRMFFESIRVDPSELFLGTRVNVWGAFAAVVIGFVIIIVQGRRHPGVEPSAYLPGREWSPDAEVVSADTYPDGGDHSAADRDGAGAVAVASGAARSTGAISTSTMSAASATSKVAAKI